MSCKCGFLFENSSGKILMFQRDEDVQLGLAQIDAKRSVIKAHTNQTEKQRKQLYTKSLYLFLSRFTFSSYSNLTLSRNV